MNSSLWALTGSTQIQPQNASPQSCPVHLLLLPWGFCVDAKAENSMGHHGASRKHKGLTFLEVSVWLRERRELMDIYTRITPPRWVVLTCTLYGFSNGPEGSSNQIFVAVAKLIMHLWMSSLSLSASVFYASLLFLGIILPKKILALNLCLRLRLLRHLG